MSRIYIKITFYIHETCFSVSATIIEPFSFSAFLLLPVDQIFPKWSKEIS